MATREDELLIGLALKNDLISKSEAAACLAESDGDVAEILVKRGLIKERHLRSLTKKLEKLAAEAPPPSSDEAAATVALSKPGETGSSPSHFSAQDATFVAAPGESGPGTSAALVLFGRIAVHKGYLSEAELKTALDYQEGLPIPRPKLGEILLHYKRMTVAQVEEVLDFQREWKSQLSGGGSSDTLPPLGEDQVSHSGRGPSTPDDPGGLLGRVWKDHRVEKVLGKGGMGAVYRAVQAQLGREVALKVMLRPPGQTTFGREERERFMREARLVASLNHPNIVTIWEADWNEDFSWFTMELVPGKDFKAVLRAGDFPIRMGATVVAKVARAMHFAHERGVIHRDLKPQNVMIDDESGEPKVLDFGLAKNVDKVALDQLTQMGAFLGTPAYMAPEQAGGDPNLVDRRADTYALGAILYEVLTGRPPFTGGSALNVIKKVLKEDPVPPQEIFPQAEPRLSAIALKALQKDPDDRFQSAGEFADAVEGVIGRVTRTLKAGPGASEGPDEESESKRGGFFGRLFGG